jgi:hypothetical protein
MLAMPGLRAFSLAAKRGSEGVSCDANGVFVGGIPLLQPPGTGNACWCVRPVVELNTELTARYRLPIDLASKAGALALISAALNRGDLAMAAIAAVQMQFPDPPSLAKRTEGRDEIARRAQELARSNLLKFWDPAKHPRTGVPPNPGWFETVTDKPGPLEPIPHTEMGNPADKPWEPPPEAEGEEGENAPRGIVELPLPGGSPGASGPGAAPKPSAPVEVQPRLPLPEGSASPASPSTWPPNPPAPGAAPRSWSPPDPKSKLPFMSETEPKLAPYQEKGPTSGIFKAGNLTIELRSGYDGPALNMPEGSSGFDSYTLAHVEGHAAALMRQYGISEAWLEINNPKICESCEDQLATMLPPGATLHVILPNRTVVTFKGRTP